MTVQKRGRAPRDQTTSASVDLTTKSPQVIVHVASQILSLRWYILFAVTLIL